MSSGKAFVRVSLGDGTYKTVVLARDTTTLMALQSIMKKLCAGRVTEAKLDDVRTSYSNAWLFLCEAGKEKERGRLLAPDECIWTEEGPPLFSLVLQLPNAEEQTELVRMQQNSGTSVDIEALIEESNPNPVKQTFVPVYTDEKKKQDLMITSSTTAEEAIEEMLSQICRNQSKKKADECRQKYKDRRLYKETPKETGESWQVLEKEDKLWDHMGKGTTFWFVVKKRDAKKKEKKKKDKEKKKDGLGGIGADLAVLAASLARERGDTDTEKEKEKDKEKEKEREGDNGDGRRSSVSDEPTRRQSVSGEGDGGPGDDDGIDALLDLMGGADEQEGRTALNAPSSLPTTNPLQMGHRRIASADSGDSATLGAKLIDTRRGSGGTGLDGEGGASSSSGAAPAGEERHFVRVDTSNDTFKTLLVTPKMTVGDTVELLYKKLCKGRVTDEKLAESKAQYADFWLYRGPENDLREMVREELIWEWRLEELYWKDRRVLLSSSGNKKKDKERDKKEKERDRKEKERKEKDKREQKKREEAKAALEAKTVVSHPIVEGSNPEEQSRVMMRIDLPGGLFKTVVLQNGTTTAEVIDMLHRKLVKGKVTDEALQAVQESHDTHALFVCKAELEHKLKMNEVLWPIVNINPQPELWYKPEKGKISLSETVEMQHKKIREMQKTIERLHHKLEQAQMKREPKRKQAKLKLDPHVVEKQEKLGAVGGSFAAVHAASLDGWKCAVKEVDTLDVGAEEGVENEIDIFLGIPPHRNVCRYLFHERTERKLSLYVELFAGTLRDVLNRYREKGKRFSAAEIKMFLYDIAAGLEHLHDNYVLHRDLKCDNVFVIKGDGCIQRCAVGDFDTSIRFRTPHDVATNVIGTPSFIAPEVLNVREVGGYGFPADVFSFGMIIYELLTLLEPYEDCQSMAEMSSKILDGIRPTIPPELKSEKFAQYHPFIDLYMRCTDFDPDLRPVMSDLVAIFRDMPIAPPPLPESGADGVEGGIASASSSSSRSTSPRPIVPSLEITSTQVDSSSGGGASADGGADEVAGEVSQGSSSPSSPRTPPVAPRRSPPILPRPSNCSPAASPSPSPSASPHTSPRRYPDHAPPSPRQTKRGSA